MSLWDIVRDWFVNYCFGGIDSTGLVNNNCTVLSSAGGSRLNSTSVGFKALSYVNNGNELYISLGDWLSTTATLIVMIAVLVALYFLVRYFFRMFAGLISGR